MFHGRLPQFKKELSEFSLFIQLLLLHLWPDQPLMEVR